MPQTILENSTGRPLPTRSSARIRWSRIGLCLCGFGLAHALAIIVPQCVRLPGQSAAEATYKLDAANRMRELLLLLIISALSLNYPIGQRQRPISHDWYAKRRTPLAAALECSGNVGGYTFFLLLLFGTASHSLADMDWLGLAAANALMFVSFYGLNAIAYYFYPQPPGDAAPQEVQASGGTGVI